VWWWPFRDRGRHWLHAAHVFGHLATASAGDSPLPIRPAGAIQPDVSLRTARINIKLDRLRLADRASALG